MKNNDFEKAQHNDGDLHPNGKWVWRASANGGKGDWRTIKKNDNSGDGGKQAAATTKVVTKKVGKPMSAEQLSVWAQNTSDDNLLKVANSKNGNAQMRKIAYDALEKRGFDMSKVDTSGTLEQLISLIGKKNVTNNAKPTAKTDSSNGGNDVIDNTNSNSEVDIDDNSDGGKDGNKITEKWYLNQEDERVKKMFNLKTKEGRIKYDQFVFKMKKKEKNYKNPVDVIQDLNEQYLEFLENDEQRFMISAGGAGIGKSYGFNKIAELLNKRPFSTGDEPGDGDYHIFEAPDINSGKQLLSVLRAHNGKIIVFDDNDKVLRRADCASVMKKATASTGKRILGDPDDIKQNFEFNGRIIILTNKNLSNLAENEDTKAIISRAMMVSEVYLTVPETIEVMESRYKDFEFDEAPRLDSKEDDDKERKEVMELIKENRNNIDPRHFTTRTFQEAIVNKRKVERANEKRSNPAFAALIGNKNKDWKEIVTETITKASDNYFFNQKPETFEKGYAYEDDGVNYEVDNFEEDEFDDVKKAQNFLFDEDENMSLQKAENILFSE